MLVSSSFLRELLSSIHLVVVMFTRPCQWCISTGTLCTWIYSSGKKFSDTLKILLKCYQEIFSEIKFQKVWLHQSDTNKCKWFVRTKHWWLTLALDVGQRRLEPDSVNPQTSRGRCSLPLSLSRVKTRRPVAQRGSYRVAEKSLEPSREPKRRAGGGGEGNTASGTWGGRDNETQVRLTRLIGEIGRPDAEKT